MMKSRLFLCSGAAQPSDQDVEGRVTVKLNTQGLHANVHLHMEDVARVFTHDLTPRLIDFLELATYVYSADASTPRGSGWLEDGSEEQWDRDFRFVLPVRDLAFWRQPTIHELLRNTLSFLSNDRGTFDFCPLENERPVQEYLALEDQDD